MAAISTLSRLPSVKDVIRIYGLVAKYQLAQNFVLDPKVTDRIVSHVSDGNGLAGSLVVEVGPGPGMLTRSLIKANADQIIVVEKDKRFLPSLRQLTDATQGRCQVIHGDILSVTGDQVLSLAKEAFGFPSRPVNLEDGVVKGCSSNDSAVVSPTLGPLTGSNAGAPTMPSTLPKIHLVGNLPFNIATPLLLQCLKGMSRREGLFAYDTDLTLMFQREVGERLVAPCHASSRSRISVMAQAYADVEMLMMVPSHQFVPRPKVDAAVVRLVPRSRPSVQEGGHSRLPSAVPAADEYPGALPEFSVLEDVVRKLFSHRRKTVKNNLSFFYEPLQVQELLSRTNIEGSIRPQDLLTSQIFNLAQAASTMVPSRDNGEG